MKLTTLLVMVLWITSAILACTSAASAVPFDGESDVDITDHTGYLGVSVDNAGDLNDDGYTDLVIGRTVLTRHTYTWEVQALTCIRIWI